MRLVAFFAVGGNHFRRVRFVALGALRDLTVDVMTDSTVKHTMLAFIVPKQSNWLGVAGATRICYFARKRHVQRHMWVHVTVEAVLKFEMGLSLMALDALRDLTMDRVTGGTVNGAMPAFVLSELNILLCVAVQTDIFVC